MRHGKCDGRVEIDGRHVAYDAAFLPHWRAFADALEQYKYALRAMPEDNETGFQLHGGVHLPSSVLDLLSNALESTHFKILLMQRNNFGRGGITFALDYMQNNPQLEKFSLYSNPINHEDDINQLCDIIKVHPAIKEIVLEECCGEGIDGH